ncbi:MAG: prepilin peptidase [Alphaproteobacteria bacterium]|nr:prepilin peptidase [Alphaproteobacteria bacterium]MDE2337583.1 prepilin peptidase [Alphaproteobacteria bacterium]
MAIAVRLMAVAVLAVTLLSCRSDIRALRIPNAHALVILSCFVPAYLAMPSAFAPLWSHLAAFSLMFAITYLMFYKGLMGGGDSKFASALALWVGLRGLVPFIFYMSLMGGLLGAATLVIRKKKPFRNPPAGSWMAEAQEGKSAVPYGLAISFGAWVAFFHTVLILH